MDNNKTTLVVDTNTANGALTKANINTLVGAGVIPKGTPLDQIKIFASTCQELGLSPFSKEIYLLGYMDRKTNSMKYNVITGINGLRKIAFKSGTHAGTSEAKFNMQPDGQHLTAAQLVKAKRKPHTATVTVKKIVQGIVCDFTHTAVFEEFNTGRQKWASMPFQMLAKCAEAHALRKAFNVSGVSIQEELGAINNKQQRKPSMQIFDIEGIKAELYAALPKDLKSTVAKYADAIAVNEDLQKIVEECS